MKKISGLSLVELIVFLGIMAVLLVIGVSTISRWIKKANVRSYAEQLTSDLEWARSLSMEYKSSCISFTSNSYKIYAPNCCSNNTCSSTTPKRSITLPSGISLTTTSTFIDFNINTLPNISSNFTLTLSGYGKTYKIVIDPNGGINFEF